MRTNLPIFSEAEAIEGVMQNLRKVVKAVEAYSRTVEARFGLTGPQLWTMWELGQESPMSLKALATRMHLSSSNLVGVVDRLISKGLVQREQDAQDRRRVRLTLTDAGVALLAKAPDPAQSRMIQGLEAMRPEVRDAFALGLEQLVQVLDANQLEAPFFFSNE